MSYRRGAGSRLFATLVLAGVALLATTVPAFAFAPGQNGAPTGGEHTDLQGRAEDVVLALGQNATIDCTQLTIADGLDLELGYEVQGDALPANATVVVYVSPNDAAIDGNADSNNDGTVSGAEADAYVAVVESNFANIDLAGRSDTGTETVSISITNSFQLVSGGVVAVIASDLNGSEATVVFDTRSNGLNCLEAATSPSPTPTATATAPPPPTPTASPGDRPTPTPSPGDQPTPEPTPATGRPAPTAPTGNAPQPTPPDTAELGHTRGALGGVAGTVLLMLVLGSIAGVLLLVRPMRPEQRS